MWQAPHHRATGGNGAQRVSQGLSGSLAGQGMLKPRSIRSVDGFGDADVSFRHNFVWGYLCDGRGVFPHTPLRDAATGGTGRRSLDPSRWL